jgi:cytochrome P450
MLHDETNFSNPESFIPTRWLENEKGKETCNKAAWIPFSHGARNCIGKPYVHVYRHFLTVSLAMMELRRVMAMFVWHFDAEFEKPGQTEPTYEDGFVAVRGPLRLRIKPIR